MRIVVAIVGTVFLVLGTLSMFTPIPGGFIPLGLGIAMLICTSPMFQRWLTHRRENNAWLNKWMSWLETHLGARLNDALRRTRPEKEE